jgi:hypothetical protein
MNLPKFSGPAVDGGTKFGAPAGVRMVQDRFSIPSANRADARKGGHSVPAGPTTGHCPNDRQGAP